MPHVWIIEVRDRNTKRIGGWTAWHMLETPSREFAFSRRADAEDACRDCDDTAQPSTQFRVARYDRREG